MATSNVHLKILVNPMLSFEMNRGELRKVFNILMYSNDIFQVKDVKLKIFVNVTSRKTEVAIKIANGPPIPLNQLESIFEPFVNIN
jgi:signal transduction histidine kinase